MRVVIGTYRGTLLTWSTPTADEDEAQEAMEDAREEALARIEEEGSDAEAVGEDSEEEAAAAAAADADYERLGGSGSVLRLRHKTDAHLSAVTASALMRSKGGDLLVTGGDDEQIHIFDLSKGKELGVLQQHKGTITALQFHKKSHLLSGSADNTICIWRTSDWACIHVLGGHKAAVTDLSIHPR